MAQHQSKIARFNGVLFGPENLRGSGFPFCQPGETPEPSSSISEVRPLTPKSEISFRFQIRIGRRIACRPNRKRSPDLMLARGLGHFASIQERLPENPGDINFQVW